MLDERLCKFVSYLRHDLNHHLYGNQLIILDLMDIIRTTIDPVSIEFDVATYSFFIKIKKTNMKKNKGFTNIPEFYYGNFIIPVFLEFIQTHYNDIVNLRDPFMTDMVISNPSALINICHVTCLSDNMVVVKL